MRKDISLKLAASLAVLATSGVPLTLAHAASGDATTAAAPTKDEAMANWPAEKKAAYDAWPSETQAYYWTLPAKRQKLFWGLTDSDKVALSSMSAPDQAKAWARIEGGGANA